MDVYVFLFTDLLLITKAKKGGDKFKVIKPVRLLLHSLSPNSDQHQISPHHISAFNTYRLWELSNWSPKITWINVKQGLPISTQWNIILSKGNLYNDAFVLIKCSQGANCVTPVLLSDDCLEVDDATGTKIHVA